MLINGAGQDKDMLMNDVIDAFGARIRSPYFGYAVLTFFALNWRGIFLLFSLDAEPQLRLAAFDEETNFWTLVVLPLLLGAIVAASSQWIRYVFQLVSRKPLDLLETMSLEAENKKLIKQNELEQQRSQYFANREEELISRAKRDEEVSLIVDQETKEKLSTQLEKLRKDRDTLSQVLNEEKSASDLSDSAKTLLKTAVNSSDGWIVKLNTLGGDYIQVGAEKFGTGDRRSYVMFESALDDLIELGLVKGSIDGDTHFELTHKGWLKGESLSEKEQG